MWRYTHSNPAGDTLPNADANAYAAKSDAHPHTHAGKPNANAHTDTHAGKPNSDAHTDPDAHSHGNAKPNSGSGFPGPQPFDTDASSGWR